MLSQYLARGLATAFSIPEERVKLFRRKGTRQPDVQVIDLFGVRVIVQGKIDNLEGAIEDSKDVIEKDLADVSFAASYPRSLAETSDIRQVQARLELSSLELAIVKPPKQLTLEGWPKESVRRLGSFTPEGLLELLQGESIYDEIVGVEAAESIAEDVTQALDEIEHLPTSTMKTVHQHLSEVLKIALEPRSTREDDSEDEDA